MNKRIMALGLLGLSLSMAVPVTNYAKEIETDKEIVTNIEGNEVLETPVTAEEYEAFGEGAKDDCEETYKLVTQMLERVNEVFKIDFRYDLELITMLSTHLMPLEIRAKHGIAFVALPFSLALKRKWKNQKEKVLIVCGSGKASSELLAYQVKENFGNYLDVVGVTNHHSLELYDFSNVDYILTTVPIDIPVPIPIIRTSTFFETSFIHQVNQAITDTRSSRFIEYFHKNMVFGSSSDDKNEILEHMCENAVQNYDIPDDFFHYVMKREEIGRTSDSSDRLGWRTRTIDLSSFHEGKRRKYDQYFYRI